MKVRITGYKKEPNLIPIGEIVTIKEIDGYYHAFYYNNVRWNSKYERNTLKQTLALLAVSYEFEFLELSEYEFLESHESVGMLNESNIVFDIKDLKSGMVVEWKGIHTKFIWKNLIIEVNGIIQGLDLDGSSWAPVDIDGLSILKVWKPKRLTSFNGIESKLTDDCLIYEAKSERQEEIDKLKQEIKEFTDKARERLKKLEELED